MINTIEGRPAAPSQVELWLKRGRTLRPGRAWRPPPVLLRGGERAVRARRGQIAHPTKHTGCQCGRSGRPIASNVPQTARENDRSGTRRKLQGHTSMGITQGAFHANHIFSPKSCCSPENPTKKRMSFVAKNGQNSRPLFSRAHVRNRSSKMVANLLLFYVQPVSLVTPAGVTSDACRRHYSTGQPESPRRESGGGRLSRRWPEGSLNVGQKRRNVNLHLGRGWRF